MARIGIVFSLNQNYVDIAKTFLKSFVDTNKKHEYYYHAYAWDKSDDLSELSEVCENLSYHVLEPQPQYPFRTDIKTQNCHRNNMYIRDVKAVDDTLKLGYDLVIHVDLDMLCIKSVEDYLDELLERKDDWELAGSEEATPELFYHRDFLREQPYKFPNRYKLNFGFLVLNPKTVKSNNIELFKAWYDLYGDSLAGCSEVYFSLQYPKQVLIRPLNTFPFANVNNSIGACIIHYVGCGKGKDDGGLVLPSPWNATLYSSDWKNILNLEIYDDLYLYYAKLAKCSNEFIKKIEDKLKFTNKNYNEIRFFKLTNLETKVAKTHGIDYVIQNIGRNVKLKSTQSKDLNIGKSICFTAVVNSNYLEPCYVCLHSLFEFNDVPVFKLLYINATADEVKKAQKRYSEISKNIEVIGVTVPHLKDETWHWTWECMEAKILALDKFTKEYDLTVLMDIDTLIQGNFKNTLLSTLFSNKKIFGVAEPNHRNNEHISKPARTIKTYLNAGLFIFKRGDYNLHKGYIDWNVAYSDSIFSEQDFISFKCQDILHGISCVNNFSICYRGEVDEKDIIMFHYPSAYKPFKNFTNSHEFNPTFPNHRFVEVVNVFYYLYTFYVRSIRHRLSKEFVEECESIPKSELVVNYNTDMLQRITN